MTRKLQRDAGTQQSPLFALQQALCVIVSYLMLSQAIYIVVASGFFRQCVHPCLRFLIGGENISFVFIVWELSTPGQLSSFLHHGSQPQRWGLPFFPDLHGDSWNKPYTS